MTRILASIFYISSMRKASEELNKEEVIANIGYVCGIELEELPYWEIINANQGLKISAARAASI